MKYMLDTTAYSELLRGHKKVGEVVRNADELYVPNVVIAELEYGFRLGNKQPENEKLLTRFVSNKKVHVLLPDNATTSYFVNIAVFAHKTGVQLSSHDIWIAALAEQWGVILVSFDKDFEHLSYEDLQLWVNN
ncbi:MAG TPA: PIN domain-containing protein [Patescibacteria group bacterium]|jgi:tRNA(fMet)-specific endonuclease VapC|nr:PIN domain-containing protein [Patescibacteria group bacterium]